MHLGRHHVHYAWDNSLRPEATVRPGQEITLDLWNAGGDQLNRQSVAQDISLLDLGRVNPVTGPLQVEGAMPGDALDVTILSLETDDWGWTANIPGFGLLADDFTEPAIAVSKVTPDSVELPFGFVIAAQPMIGTIGVALPDDGAHSMIPPRRFGGNLDVRHITAGARISLPVGVEGALLSVGDAHASMGDGEICGTGIEVDAQVRLRIDLRKGAAPRTPVLHTSGSAARDGAALATMGIGPDLMEATRHAAREMVRQIARVAGVREVEAYMLASVAADLKIAEVVDAPNWVVTMHLEERLLSGHRR